jgi:hypothetical protein
MRALIATIARSTGIAALALLVLAIGVWGTLLLAFAGPGVETTRLGLAVAFGVASAVAFAAIFTRRWRAKAAMIYALLGVPLAVVWNDLTPTNDRDWQPEVAVLPYATMTGERVTVHNVRNFDYRSETDYTIAYYDRTYDLRDLRSADLVTSYWMGPDVAHVFVSFGFEGDRYLAVSIEVRKPRGVEYSTLKGFFRQYELVYVAADERDVIRLRTNYRRDPPEDVYLYRLAARPAAVRRLFLEYMYRMNRLEAAPEFYNTLTTNCTTSIWMNDRVNSGGVPLSWKILVSGHVPEYLYDEGRLETGGLSFPELRQRAHVNAQAGYADSAADFSRQIRAPVEVQESAQRNHAQCVFDSCNRPSGSAIPRARTGAA